MTNNTRDKSKLPRKVDHRELGSRQFIVLINLALETKRCYTLCIKLLACLFATFRKANSLIATSDILKQ